MTQGDADPKTSVTNTAKPSTETFEERESRTKELLLGFAKRHLAVRNKDREFHGLEREFLYAQAQMLVDYEKSKDIKHPRDVGNTREAILGRFLESSGYLPKKYSVSNTSVRVASTDGFISKEIDILIFDSQGSIILMQREDAYEVYGSDAVSACSAGVAVARRKRIRRTKELYERTESTITQSSQWVRQFFTASCNPPMKFTSLQTAPTHPGN